jgi:tetratricopeptide (TPR) repeat protein
MKRNDRSDAATGKTDDPQTKELTSVEPSAERLLRAAEGYLELDLPDRALECLRDAPKEMRDTFEWNFLHGEVYRAKGGFDSAVEYLERARQLGPESIPVCISLGWCYKRLDQLRRAIEILHDAHNLCDSARDRDGYALVSYNLSCYYALAGDKAAMLQWLRKALQLQSGYRRLIPIEPDFDRFRHDVDFQKLVRGNASK